MSNLRELLTQQYEQLSLLETVIASEKDILQQHNPDALIKISQEKNTVLLSIEKIDQLIVKHPDFIIQKSSGVIDEVLANIAQKLEHCKEQNIVNGQIIQQSQLAVERMKTSLLENHNKSAITYDNKGKKSAGLSSIGLKA